MKQMNCPHEAAVARAARSGSRDESLESHVAECAVCREVMAVARSMQSLPYGFEATRSLPDADLLWCRALLARKQTEAERTRKSLALAQAAPLLVIALIFAGWLVWSGSEFLQWPAGFFAALQLSWRALASAPYIELVLLSPLAAVILALGVLLVAHPLLAED